MKSIESPSLPPSRGLVTARELASYLGLSVATLYRGINEGKNYPPAVMLGERTMFRVADVEAWLSALPPQDDTVRARTAKATEARHAKKIVRAEAA